MELAFPCCPFCVELAGGEVFVDVLGTSDALSVKWSRHSCLGSAPGAGTAVQSCKQESGTRCADTAADRRPAPPPGAASLAGCSLACVCWEAERLRVSPLDRSAAVL